MPNPYFEFKQFRINQDQCALKVCTDACILGAWFAAKTGDHNFILDIGSGTGLLMMMLAQQSAAEIHGIEIDLPSFKQLKENIGQNDWRERLKVFPGDVRSYRFPEKYDFIICNPPFFENDLVSASEEEQVAKHSLKLSWPELLDAIDRNLQPSGSFGVLIPAVRTRYFIELASERSFYPTEILRVQQKRGSSSFRAILHFSRHREEFVPEFDLVIREESGDYSAEFTELLKPYYLYL